LIVAPTCNGNRSKLAFPITVVPSVPQSALVPAARAAMIGFERD